MTYVSERMRKTCELVTVFVVLQRGEQGSNRLRPGACISCAQRGSVAVGLWSAGLVCRVSESPSLPGKSAVGTRVTPITRDVCERSDMPIRALLNFITDM